LLGSVPEFIERADGFRRVHDRFAFDAFIALGLGAYPS
jgi:hypothetical protein